MSKYGEPVKVKTKAAVIEHIDNTRDKLGKRLIGDFYDVAVKEKIERESKKTK